MNRNSTKNRKIAGLCLLALMGAGCAGPATPFGAVEIKEARESRAVYKKTWVQTLLKLWDTPEIKVTSHPQTKVFHRSKDVSFTIADTRGFTRDSAFYVFYNGRDVTKHFTRVNSSANEITLHFPGLRLNPRRLHQIDLAYKRDANTPIVTYSMAEPTCSLSSRKPIQSFGPFHVDENMQRDIASVSDEWNVNPGLLAALVAQESGFNPKAVSFHKAIGLTQMTHIAEEEILDQINAWPRFPGIRRYSYPALKLKIATGAIDADKEWRLRPDLSLQGGAMFLNHIKKYWSRPQKRLLIEKSKADLNQVLLASYNIGAAAVSGALERKGSQWLTDKAGSTALKYVQMVGSYCNEFTDKDFLEPNGHGI